MEDFLGTLIYIIIAIAGIIVSVINKKSKEEKVKQEYPEFDEEPVYRTSDNYFNKGLQSVDDFFAQNFSDEEPRYEEQHEPLAYTEEITDTPENRYENVESGTETGKFHDQTEQVTSKKDIEVPYKQTPYRKPRKTDRPEPVQRVLERFRNDPRQAVILSEIINRKHF